MHPTGDFLDEPCLDLPSGNRFTLETSVKHTLPDGFWWKTILTPTGVSTSLGSLCLASDLSQRAWQTVLCPGQWPCSCRWSLAGAWHGPPLGTQRDPPVTSPALRGWHYAGVGGLWGGHYSSLSFSRLSASSRWLRFRQSEKQSA